MLTLILNTGSRIPPDRHGAQDLGHSCWVQIRCEISPARGVLPNNADTSQALLNSIQPLLGDLQAASEVLLCAAVVSQQQQHCVGWGTQR